VHSRWEVGDKETQIRQMGPVTGLMLLTLPKAVLETGELVCDAYV
jgi:hypothetical protein